MQGAGLTIRSNFGFSVLLKDTYIHGQEELGIKPPTLWLVFDPLTIHQPMFNFLHNPVLEIIEIHTEIPGIIVDTAVPMIPMPMMQRVNEVSVRWHYDQKTYFKIAN